MPEPTEMPAPTEPTKIAPPKEIEKLKETAIAPKSEPADSLIPEENESIKDVEKKLQPALENKIAPSSDENLGKKAAPIENESADGPLVGKKHCFPNNR